MSDAVDAVTRGHGVPATRGRPIAFWGVVLLAVTESMLFVVLLVSWFYLWSRESQWPPAGVEPPELVVSGIRSVVLLSTSATIWLAERGLRRGDRRAAWNWTVATVAGAGFFLATHVREFVWQVPREFLWSDHAYGSMYWTILNFHGAHVAVGIIIWVFMLVRLGRGAFGPDDTVPFETASIYWHAVDAIWVFVWTSMYLLPNLLGG